MTNTIPNITNLVFKGGGVKGSAYAGCLEVLEQRGLYDNIEQVAGTSAGAITASLLAAGAGSAGLAESVKHTEFKNFIKDSWGIIGDADRLVKDYGLHTADGLVSLLKEYYEKFAGDAEITFAQLDALACKQPKKYKKLSLIASDITSNRSHIFNAKNNPNLPIWQAVRASMSIPLVFEPAKIEDKYFVDGGLAWNYPIDIFDRDFEGTINNGDTPVRNKHTLGFYLEPKESFSNPDKFDAAKADINSIQTFASGLIDFMYQSANLRYIHPDDQDRTVFVDDLGVSATDFNLSETLVDELVKSGKLATEKYFAGFDFKK